MERGNVMTEQERQQTKKQQILDALQNAPDGLTNRELDKIALRYGGYIKLLRNEGYKIKTINLSNGLFKYKLEGKTEPTKTNAIESLKSILNKKGHVEVSEAITDLLNEAGVALRFKANVNH